MMAVSELSRFFLLLAIHGLVVLFPLFALLFHAQSGAARARSRRVVIHRRVCSRMRIDHVCVSMMKVEVSQSVHAIPANKATEAPRWWWFD